MHSRSVQRLLWRAADRIRTHARNVNDRCIRNLLPVDAWERLASDCRKFLTSHARGWRGPAEWYCAQYEYSMRSFQARLEACRREVELAYRSVGIASFGDIWNDLLALHDEFEEVEYRSKDCCLSVTTAPIILEDVNLGRFKIILRWDRPHERMDYSVVALNPNPCQTDNRTTHPHVHDESLCEGEGELAIQNALAQLRLYDFFVLVHQVLQTYNADSAYARLDAWSGSPCRDCGATIRHDEGAWCGQCEGDVCDDCRSRCNQCDRTLCSECGDLCQSCKEVFCVGCLSTCPQCDRSQCAACLDEQACGCPSGAPAAVTSDAEDLFPTGDEPIFGVHPCIEP